MMEKVLLAAGTANSGVAVAIQLWLAIERFTSEGMSLPGSVVAFFSFFTILTNIYVVLVYIAALTPGRLAFFRRPAIRACALVSILLVGLVYHFLLASIWNPEGLTYVTDKMLHYAAPAIMLVWWAAWGRSGSLRWADLPGLLIYPAAYLAYVALRAPIAGQVPYPFMDPSSEGWTPVIQTALGITVVFIVIGALAIAADRHLPARPLSGTPA